MYALIVFGVFFLLIFIWALIVGKLRARRMDKFDNKISNIINGIMKIQPGMTQNDVERILGKPDYYYSKYDKRDYIAKNLYWDLEQYGSYPIGYGDQYTFCDTSSNGYKVKTTNTTTSQYFFFYFEYMRINGKYGCFIKYIVDIRGNIILDYSGGFVNFKGDRYY